MPQHNFNITVSDANTGITFRAAVNAALQALAGLSSGTGDPSITYPFQLKVNTDSNPMTLVIRNAANNAWHQIGHFDANGKVIIDTGYGVTSVTANYTATLNDEVILANATADAVAVTLPTAVGNTGKKFVVKKIDSSVNAVTVDPNGSETIDGQATASVKNLDETIIVVSDGTNWRRLLWDALDAVASITADYTATLNDDTILANATAGAVTVSLPTAVGNTGKKFVIKKIDSSANTVTVDPNGSETIDGQATAGILAQDNAIICQSDGANWRNISKLSTLPAIRDIARGLVVMNNITNPNYQVDIDINEIVLQDNSSLSLPYIATAVDLTLDVTVNGINGHQRTVKTGTASCSGTTVTGSGPLFTTEFAVGDVIWFNTAGGGRKITAIAGDKALNIESSLTASSQAISNGGEAPSTWYYLWVIHDNITVAGLLSTSNTAPIMPSGYTYKALVGAVYNNSSSNFISLYQQGARVRCDTGTFDPANTSATSTSIATFVPVTAKMLHCRFYSVIRRFCGCVLPPF